MLFNLAISSGNCFGSMAKPISRSVKNSSFSAPITLSPGAIIGSSYGGSKTFFWYGFKEKINYLSD